MSIFKTILALFSTFIPRPVPTTDAGVETLIESILAKAGVPLNPSTQQAVAVMIQGLLRNNYRISINRVVKELRRGMANQALFNLVQDAREKEKIAKADKGPASAVVQET